MFIIYQNIYQNVEQLIYRHFVLSATYGGINLYIIL